MVGLETVLGTEENWAMMLSLSLIPAVLQYLTLPFCPESPRYLLINQGREEQAEKGRLCDSVYVLKHVTICLNCTTKRILEWTAINLESIYNLLNVSVFSQIKVVLVMLCVLALQRLRGNPDTVLQEMEEMKEEATHSESSITLREFLTKRRYRQPIRLVLIINLGSQLSGFNAVSSSSSMLRTENNLGFLSALDFSP